MAYEVQETLSGTHGQLWINDVLFEEVTKFSAELNPEFADVNKGGSMAKYKKLIGYEGKGEVTMNKVTSKLMRVVADNLMKGKQTMVKIVSNLDDPDSRGNERIVIYDAILEKSTLADWESKSVGEEKIPFTFTRYEILEDI